MNPFAAELTRMNEPASRSLMAIGQRAPMPRGVRLTATIGEGADAESSHDASTFLAFDCNRNDLLDAVLGLIGSALQARMTTGFEDDSAVRHYQPPIPSRPRGGIAPSALRRIREHIERNLGEHIDTQQLANLAGLSTCHFSRAFKQSMGMPPHRYLLSRRVREAARLIESTQRPMSEIALDVGFSDQSHFTRVFTALIGQSPSHFRHQCR